MLAALFLLASCDMYGADEETPTYVGTWEIDFGEYGSYTYKLKTSSYIATSYDENGIIEIAEKGSLSTDGDQMSFKMTSASGDGSTWFSKSVLIDAGVSASSFEPYIYTWAVEGGELTLTHDGYAMVLTKK